MSLGRGVVIAAVALLALVPVADAQIQNPNESTPTTLYFHIFDTFNKFVINTQPMNTEFFEVGGTNFPTLCGTAANEQVLEADYCFNTIYGTSTAGPVEYDFIENGRPRFHPERGIAADVQIDGSSDITAFLYIEPRDPFGTTTAPFCIPELHVRVTMRTGDDPGPDAQLDAGELIMQGQQTHTICTPPMMQLPIAEQLGAAPHVNGAVEYAVPMELSRNTIPQDEAFNVRIDWWVEDPGGAVCGTPGSDGTCAPGYLRLKSSQSTLPRLEMNVMNPVYISFIHPQVAAGTLLIHTGVNSPWGTYDIDYNNITIGVAGPSTPRNLQEVVASNQHVHGLHHLDAEITYLWRFRDEGATDGQYTITMEVPNLAGNSVARGQAGFTVEGRQAFGIADDGEIVPGTDDDSQDSPGIGVIALLGLLAAAFVVRRRS